MTLYDELGVSKDASAADIKRAHRQRVAKCHPDAGGDRDEFERVQGAYLVLKDPGRRQHYDDTGDADLSVDNAMSEMTDAIMKAFDQVLGRVGKDFRRQDIIAGTRALLQQRKREIASNCARARAERALQEELVKRLTFDGDGPDVILGAVRQRIMSFDRRIERAEHEEETTDRALAYLEAYGFEFDAPLPDPELDTPLPDPEFVMFSLGGGLAA